MERPFPRLVSHFATRLLRGGQRPAAAEFDLGIAGVLGALAAAAVSIGLPFGPGGHCSGAGCLAGDKHRRAVHRHSIPPRPEFRGQIPAAALGKLSIWGTLAGYAAFALLPSAIEHWMLKQPMRFLFVPGAMLAAWLLKRGRLWDDDEPDSPLVFEEIPPPAVQRLDLLNWG